MNIWPCSFVYLHLLKLAVYCRMQHLSARPTQGAVCETFSHNTYLHNHFQYQIDQPLNTILGLYTPVATRNLTFETTHSKLKSLSVSQPVMLVVGPNLRTWLGLSLFLWITWSIFCCLQLFKVLRWCLIAPSCSTREIYTLLPLQWHPSIRTPKHAMFCLCVSTCFPTQQNLHSLDWYDPLSAKPVLLYRYFWLFLSSSQPSYSTLIITRMFSRLHWYQYIWRNLVIEPENSLLPTALQGPEMVPDRLWGALLDKTYTSLPLQWHESVIKRSNLHIYCCRLQLFKVLRWCPTAPRCFTWQSSTTAQSGRIFRRSSTSWVWGGRLWVWYA